MVKSNIVQQLANLGKDPVKLPTYSKKGFLLEYPTFTKSYILSLILRTLSFLFDFIIPAGMQYLIWKLMNNGLIMSGAITIIYYHMYYFLTMMVLNGRTIGLAIAKRRVVHKSGFKTSMFNYYMRSMVSATLAIPVIGWGLILLNGLSLLMLRGISLIDLITQTIVVSSRQYEELELIERLEKYD